MPLIRGFPSERLMWRQQGAEARFQQPPHRGREDLNPDQKLVPLAGIIWIAVNNDHLIQR